MLLQALTNDFKKVLEVCQAIRRQHAYRIGIHRSKEQPCRPCLVKCQAEIIERCFDTLHDPGNFGVECKSFARELLGIGFTRESLVLSGS
jgi:hypothetical protein